MNLNALKDLVIRKRKALEKSKKTELALNCKKSFPALEKPLDTEKYLPNGLRR